MTGIKIKNQTKITSHKVELRNHISGNNVLLVLEVMDSSEMVRMSMNGVVFMSPDQIDELSVVVKNGFRKLYRTMGVIVR